MKYYKITFKDNHTDYFIIDNDDNFFKHERHTIIYKYEGGAFVGMSLKKEAYAFTDSDAIIERCSKEDYIASVKKEIDVELSHDIKRLEAELEELKRFKKECSEKLNKELDDELFQNDRLAIS